MMTPQAACPRLLDMINDFVLLRFCCAFLVLVSPLYVSKSPQSCFPAPLCDILYIQSLPDVIVSHKRVS